MSKKHIGPFLSIGLAILIIGQPAYVSVAFPQGPPQQITTPAGRVIVPPSSIERPEERGLRAHTNHLIFVPGRPQVTPGPPAGENPGSLACVYNIVSLYQNSGCPTTTVSRPAMCPAARKSFQWMVGVSWATPSSLIAW